MDYGFMPFHRIPDFDVKQLCCSTISQCLLLLVFGDGGLGGDATPLVNETRNTIEHCATTSPNSTTAATISPENVHLSWMWEQPGNHNTGTYKHAYTLWLSNIAMENDPFIDGLPIKNCDFPWLC